MISPELTTPFWGASQPRRLPEEQFLLALTRLFAQRAGHGEELRALLEACDQQRLGDLIYEQGVLALHGTRLLELAADQVSSELRERIDSAVALNGRRALVLEKLLDDALAALAAHGIAALPFKGPRLASAAHGDPALRSSIDLDVLVAPAELRAAASALAAVGFTPGVDRLRADGLPELHLTLVHREPWAPRLDLHWRVHWADTTHAQTLLEGRPADDLAILMLCYVRDGLVGVRLASDIGGWWDRHGAELPERAFEPLVAAHPALGPALATAVRASAALTGLDAEALLSPASLGLAPSQALRMTDPLARADPQQLRAQTALVEWSTIPRPERRGFFRRRIAHAAELEGVDRVLHVPKILARIAMAALRGAPQI